MQVVVDTGTKVDNKDLVYLTEMLMRQLLNLDEMRLKENGKCRERWRVSVLCY